MSTIAKKAHFHNPSLKGYLNGYKVDLVALTASINETIVSGKNIHNAINNLILSNIFLQKELVKNRPEDINQVKSSAAEIKELESTIFQKVLNQDQPFKRTLDLQIKRIESRRDTLLESTPGETKSLEQVEEELEKLNDIISAFEEFMCITKFYESYM